MPRSSPGPGRCRPHTRQTGTLARRMIGEVVVDLGFADRETVEEAVEVAARAGPPDGRGAGRARGAAPRPAGARGGRAIRAGLHRPVGVRPGHGRGPPDRRRRRQALPGRAGGLHRRRDAAAGDGRPHERADDRRRRDDHRAAGARRGRLGRGPRPAADAPCGDGGVDRRHRRRRAPRRRPSWRRARWPRRPIATRR